MNELDFSGKQVLVVGGSSGIGNGIAQMFRTKGARVAVCGTRASAADYSPDEGSHLDGLDYFKLDVSDPQAIEKFSPSFATLDVADREKIVSVVNDVAAHFGGLDIIVNNAGISVRVAIDDDGYDEAWAKGIAVMLTAHPRIIRAALPYLRKSKSPRIVNIASTEALGATALHSPYSAAKAGVAGLTRSLAVELTMISEP